jgi:hypothetical protein
VISARDPSGHRGQAPVQALPARDPSGERTPSRLALGALAQVRALALRRQVVLPPAPPASDAKRVLLAVGGDHRERG